MKSRTFCPLPPKKFPNVLKEIHLVVESEIILSFRQMQTGSNSNHHFILFVGSLPLLDNWEIFGGLIFGTFISIVVLPYITFGKWDVLQKKIILAVTIPITIVMYVFILYLFFEVQNVSDNCPSCKAFNCASYTDNNCEIEKLV